MPRFSEYIYNISNKFFKTKINSSVLTRNLTQARITDEIVHKPIYHRLPVYFEERDP